MIEYDMEDGHDLVIYDNHWDNVEAWIQRHSNYDFEEAKDTRVPYRKPPKRRYSQNRKTKADVVRAKRTRGTYKLRIFD
jgi:hypothetical protein